LEEVTGDGEGFSGNVQMVINLGSIKNHSVDSCQPDWPSGSDDNSTDTCYVKLTSWTTADGSSGLIDEGIASYTVVANVTVSARVDPTFTFTVGADAASSLHNGITTSVATTYNTIPFSNLTAGTPKYAAHKLNVTTNTENGYNIYVRMATQMNGVYTNNNVDPFAKTGVSWGNPLTWQEPTGTTPNDNTGWIGANTTDADITDFTTLEFGPVGPSDQKVMTGSRSDNGTTAVYVTYAIEANVFQPADTYTGTLMYTATPTY
jgi:hypothetical protein